MALTLTPVKGASYALSNKKARVYDITADNSYATGGYSLTPAQVGLRVIDQTVTHGLRKSDGSAIVQVSHDRANNKLILFSGGAQVTNATDLSAYSGRVTFIG